MAARSWLKKGAYMRDANALYTYGNLLIQDEGESRELFDGLDSIKSAAAIGNEGAALWLEKSGDFTISFSLL